MRFDSVELPKGAVLACCALVLTLPAALALGHTFRYNSQDRWVHHHTTSYTTCNQVNQDTALRDRIAWAKNEWADISAALEFPSRSVCHPATGAAAHIQAIDGYLGNTGWRASSTNDPGGANSTYHAEHTHIQFNLSANWDAYTGYDRRALACREIGWVIGLAHVGPGSWLAHGDDNDCMSFDGSPNAQISKDENSNIYTYTDHPRRHSRDQVDSRYGGHFEPNTSLAGGPAGPTIQTSVIFSLSSDGSDRTFECGLGRTVSTMPAWSACPSEVSYSNLSDGQYRFEARARDQSGRVDPSPVVREFLVDTTDPLLEPTTGSLVDSAQNIDPDVLYDLEMAASDGDPSAPESWGSGVERLEVFVTGEGVARYAVEQQCTSPSRSCRLDITTNPDAAWQVPLDEFAPGENHLQIVATDAVGNATTSAGPSVVVEDINPPVTSQSFCDPVTAGEDETDELLSDVDMETVDEIANSELGAGYGGSWIDRSVCPTRLSVGVQAATESQLGRFEAELENYPAIDATRVRVEDVAYTALQLDNAANAAAGVLENASSSEFVVGHRYPQPEIDVEAETLSAQLRTDVVEAIEDALPTPVPDGAVQPRAPVPASPASFSTGANWADPTFVHANRTQYPNYEAGLRTHVDGTCTTGFTLRRKRNFFASTALHCMDEFAGPSTMYGGVGPPNGPVIGQVVAYTNENDDLLMSTLIDRFATRRIYTGGGGHRTVTRRMRLRSYGRGRVLCYQGITSNNNNCGQINRVIRKVRVRDAGGHEFLLRHSVCINEPGDKHALGGDSGGPIYDVRSDGSANAAGVLSFVTRRDDSCFTRIGRAVDELGVRVALAGRG